MNLSLWQWIGISLLAVIGLEGFWIRHQASEIDGYRSAVATYQSAQKTNLAAILELQNANKRWADAAKASQDKVPSLVKQHIDFTNLQMFQNSDANQKLKVIYVNNPSAKAWSDVVPDPAIVQQLRANGG